MTATFLNWLWGQLGGTLKVWGVEFMLCTN